MARSHSRVDEQPVKGPLRILWETIGCVFRGRTARQTPPSDNVTSLSQDVRISKWKRVAQRRRILEKKGGAGFTETEFKQLCEQYEGRCLCCGGRLDLTADHVVPLSKGGSHSIDNIQPLCKECNSRKHTLAVDFRKEDNRFSFFVSKSGRKRHILKAEKARTLCGLQAHTAIRFSDVSGELPLCRKCKWALHSELERLQIKTEEGSRQSA